ncbi:Methyl-accepting chemotaxis protein PctA [Marinomonas spartinae]|uniref:Methyl-accepting chemotaxis protein PctA n=1 Tax=Marinomonas spartinae TaxID=1792290 RepID=A0A1A8T402_9GAMM|nr:methyl-accepting chemotaxis protein [Marinomonas spartinae]SBS26181.1 Methyl-accepting chemotaxis protein PctA [Marinomonas spartinae]SBS40012.1 Methyl-accepting chemotaxis protein PctA [Marinomonas spartinae]
MLTLSTIRAKYTVAFGILTAVFLGVVIATFILVSYLQSSVGKFADGASLIQNADRDLYQSRLALASLVFDKAAQNPDELKLKITSNAQQALERMQAFLSMTQDVDEINQALNEFDTLYKSWKDNTMSIIAMVDNKQYDGATLAFVAQNQTHFTSLRNLYDQSEELIDKYSELEQNSIDEYANSFKTFVGILAMIVVAFSVSLAWFAPKNISNSIRRVTFGVQQISSGDGDLTRRINSVKKDETGELSRELDGFVARLGKLIGDVKYGCEHIREEMHNLGESASQSAGLSERQNTALDFIVTAVEEMGGATREVAHNATQTVDEVEALNRCADEGAKQLKASLQQLDDLAKQVSNASSVIEQLSSRSDRIASVLDVILGIAEQTNLLALNAAIEAARAGEQGRGFAVVADEVRNLASKTQDSTADIQNMINDLQSGVTNAVHSISESVKMSTLTVDLTQETAASIDVIKASATRIYDFTTQTASATEQQSKVTDEINQNLSNLADMSKEVLGISRSISESVNETLTNSDALAKQVKRFIV